MKPEPTQAENERAKTSLYSVAIIHTISSSYADAGIFKCKCGFTGSRLDQDQHKIKMNVDMVASELAAVRGEAATVERERCAATQCKWCRDSVPVELRDVTDEYDDAETQILFWQHRFDNDGRNSWKDCSAHAIRKLTPNHQDTLREMKREAVEPYRVALLAHRADLHGWSKRPCPTCRQSAEALGIANLVPNSCSVGENDERALLADGEEG